MYRGIGASSFKVSGSFLIISFFDSVNESNTSYDLGNLLGAVESSPTFLGLDALSGFLINPHGR